MLFKKKYHPLRWLIWALGISFYFYEFLLRVFPSIMVSDLERVFSLDAGSFGVMTAFYFYIYAPMQIPVGNLVDRFGARKLLTFAIFTCSIGAFLFAFATEVWMLDVSRLLMGLGSSFAFVCMAYISSHWFDISKLALLLAIANSLGMLGAVFGEGPLQLLVDHTGWQKTVIILGVIGLVLALIVFLIVRNEPKEVQHLSSEKSKSSVKISELLKEVLSNKQVWMNSLGGFFLYACISSFAGLWADPFLQSAHQFSKDDAAFAGSAIFLGIIIGGPLFGHFSDKMKKRKPFLISASLIAAGILLSIVLIERLSTTAVFILLFLLGCMLAVQMLTYIVSVMATDIQAKGTAIAVTNFFAILSAVIYQPIVGFLLDLGRQTTATAFFYPPIDFRLAMLIFPISLLVAAVFFCFLKDPIVD